MLRAPMRPATLTLFVITGVVAVGLELLALAIWRGWLPQRALPAPAPAVIGALEVRDLPPLPPGDPVARAENAYYEQLRVRLRWAQARVGKDLLPTLDLPSRMLLAKSAAAQARLHEVGLGFADVYGIINAESSWAPRMGASRDGTPNIGIAQFEPATAAALGVRDPHDVVEAVHAAAAHMREAAAWSAARLSGLRLSRQERAERLREGVSVYYNLSSRGRAAWEGRGVGHLPPATQSHVRNAKLGAKEAAWLATRPEVLQALQPLPDFGAAAAEAPATPLALNARGPAPMYAQ